MKNFDRALAVVLFLIASTAGFGQEAKLETKPEIEACNTEFAKFLVDQQVTESRAVAETDKRIRILARSGDFVWKLDQAAGREYFTEAFKVANERFNEKGFEKKTFNVKYTGGSEKPSQVK